MAHITINFSNVTLFSSNSAIILKGGTFALNINEGFGIFGTVAFSSMYTTTSAISFNVIAGTAFNATVQVPVVSTTTGKPPSIEVTNFQGNVAVTWPTATGLQTQKLNSGNRMTLSGYVG